LAANIELFEEPSDSSTLIIFYKNYESPDEEDSFAEMCDPLDENYFPKVVPLFDISIEIFKNLIRLTIQGFNLNGKIDVIVGGMPCLEYLGIEDCTNSGGSKLNLSKTFIDSVNLKELYLMNSDLYIKHLALPPNLKILECSQKIAHIDASRCGAFEDLEVHSWDSIYDYGCKLIFDPPPVPCLRLVEFDCEPVMVDYKGPAFRDLERLNIYVDHDSFLDLSEMKSLLYLCIFGANPCEKFRCRFPPREGSISVEVTWNGDDNSTVREIQLYPERSFETKFSWAQ